MPIFRKKDGNVPQPSADDVATQVLDRPQNSPQQPSISSEAPTDLLADEPPTVIVPSAQAAVSSLASSADEPKTVLLGANKRQAKATTEDANGMDDPVVGWVVITKGAGQGKSRCLGYGQNSIGRGNTERVSLDFGAQSDEQISRSKHAIITFDPKGKKYYLHSGDGTNLTYLNDVPVLMPVEISGGEEIVLGETHLCFVPFCGENFDWNS